MKEQVVRGCFSALAALVFTATSAEWAMWALTQHRPWKFLPAAFLAALTTFETAQVWRRVDKMIEGLQDA